MNPAVVCSTTRLVAIVTIGCASGCGSAITMLPAASDLSGPWVTRTANHVSLSVPSDWHVGQPWLSAGSFTDLVGSYSNQTLSTPCVTGLNSISCGAPLKELHPGGMLVEVYENGFPGWSLSSQPGAPTFVSGLPAHVSVQAGAHDSCTGLGVDKTRTEVIAEASDNYVQVVICSLGPDPAQDAVASRIFASVRVAVATPTSGPIGICQASQLQAAVDKLNPPDSQQKRSAFLSLSNAASSTCTLEGYPDVRPYDGSDQPIAVTLEHGGFGDTTIKDPGPRPITLQPGDTAYFGMTWASWGGTGCVSASSIGVTPPAGGTPLVLVAPLTDICMIGLNPGPLALTAIAPKEAFSGSSNLP